MDRGDMHKVSKLKNGTVIDHVPQGRGLTVVHILDIAKTIDRAVLIGMNLLSGKFERKDIVKIENIELDEQSINKLAILAPDVTISLIRDYAIVKKMNPHLPDEVQDIIQCSNPMCITQHETLGTIFNIESKKPLKIRCKYCERVMAGKEVLENIK